MIGAGRFGNPAASSALILPNLLTKTEVFTDNAVWIVASVTVTGNQIASPNGSLTGDLITSGNAVNQGLYQLVTVSASTVYCFSYFVQLGAMAVGDFKLAFYNATGAAFISSNITPVQVPVAGSWVRVSQSVTTPVGCVSMRVYPFRNSSAVAGTFYLWGAMLNTGPVAAVYAEVA